MTTITLHQRKIIIHGTKSTTLNTSDECMPFILSKTLSENNQLLIGLYCLALMFMESKSNREVLLYSQKISRKNKPLEIQCGRVLRVANNSNNRVENAIKEITKIALEITHTNE